MIRIVWLVVLFLFAVACEDDTAASSRARSNSNSDTDVDSDSDADTDSDSDSDTDGDSDSDTDSDTDSDSDSDIPAEVTPGSYALPAPDQCLNQYWVEGCIEGDASSTCGGQCESKSACETGKVGATTGFMCPRMMLFHPVMMQAVKDDAATYSWSQQEPFMYAVAGHDSGPLDENPSTCCECYQLVLDKPEQQVRDQETDEPVVSVPKPLIVQSFNTAAGDNNNFDVFMAAGGFGNYNGCDPNASVGVDFDHQYLGYPTMGQPNGGGVKAVGSDGSMCKNQHYLVTLETLSAGSCQDYIAEQCDMFESSNPEVVINSKHSCIESNKPDTLYHQNWEVLARRINCPAGLTQVTGCKLVHNDSLPEADPAVQTAAQARSAGFFEGYTTTTMQDCCKPTCSWQDEVTGEKGNLTAEGLFNSFYTCDAVGNPFTE